jgi:hypothetical protein|tara:strand:- start:448 stop:705 length:258 start_codon:yes stop_codon:yes gene_type:complete
MKTISRKTVKETTLKVNDFALKNTEKIIFKTIEKVEDLQGLTAKKLKSSLDFSAKKQENIFNSLESAKGMVWVKLNRAFDFFSKN